eukprot:TRINITY_DN16682_c0_g1_i1.p1 TRINITY_DN16682_c0_g1~~TRINITY_DN16682_c0_g1_i1.p1  ORF type:complete len:251 (-),score=76.46 TRINITY_DN16682_c0_g1_i1:152-904(-)
MVKMTSTKGAKKASKKAPPVQKEVPKDEEMDSGAESAQEQEYIFGLNLVPGKIYKQVVSVPFRIANCSLHNLDSKSSGSTRLCLKYGESEFTLASLIAGVNETQQLDLMFGFGDDIALFLKGDMQVSLLGNYMPEQDENDDLDLSDLDEEMFAKMTDSEKMALLEKKGVLPDDMSSGDEPGIEDMADDNDSEDEEEEEEEPVPAPPVKKAKLGKKHEQQPAKGNGKEVNGPAGKKHKSKNPKVRAGKAKK